VATEWLDDGTPVVSVMGELDAATSPTLEQTFLALADDAQAVIVDLRACSFIDSSSLKVLIASERRLNRCGRQLLLVICNPCVLRVFEITRVDKFFKIYHSLGLALEGERHA
jgi:anti-sigma B factor antagonist